jgi:hypothetical protein
VFEDGADYVILRVDENKALKPIPDVPRFTNMAAARRWLGSQAAEALAGMKLAVVRFHALAALEAEQRVRLTLKDRPKFRVRVEDDDESE